MPMKILVTGGAGYLGSVLVPKLLLRGHEVRVLDIGYFGLGPLRSLRPGIEIIRDDIRRFLSDAEFAKQMLEGCDAVIHLAAISNDPSAELHPELTEEVNFQTTIAIAEAAKKAGVRFLFSSSCSVYGEAEGELTEDSMVNPLTVYAISKVKSDNVLLQMADHSWKPVILRNGTLFGYSPRMRFDLVVNIFSLYSTIYNEIRVFGDGLQWRPFLSVQDCARAFIFFVENREPSHIMYNIASENLRVVDVAEVFGRINPRVKVKYVPQSDPDKRDYRVSAARMRAEGFEPQWGLMASAEQIAEAIVSGQIPDPESIFYRNAKWLGELTQIGNKDHRHIVDLMESFSVIRKTATV
jgi:nucleoside-diphosphate-sugar epimerase